MTPLVNGGGPGGGDEREEAEGGGGSMVAHENRLRRLHDKYEDS